MLPPSNQKYVISPYFKIRCLEIVCRRTLFYYSWHTNYHIVVHFWKTHHQRPINRYFSGHQALQLLWSKPLFSLSFSKVDVVKGTLGHSHGTNFCTNFFHSTCIAFWPIGLLPTTFYSQHKISLPYLMISILLHKLELNEKRCLLNKSCSILCPNDGNISLVYGGSFVGYLQRDNCENNKAIFYPSCLWIAHLNILHLVVCEKIVCYYLRYKNMLITCTDYNAT